MKTDGKGKKGKLMSFLCCFDYQTGISLIICRVDCSYLDKSTAIVM